MDWKHILQEIPKYLLVAGVILFISLLFPNNSRFKYEYRLNQVWGYDDVAAPFDFPLLKSGQELEAERREIQERFVPYYEISPTKAREALHSFGQVFDAKLESAKKSDMYPDVQAQAVTYRDAGEDLLKELYTKGVVKWDTLHQDLPENRIVNLLEGNTQNQIAASHLMTQGEALTWLTDRLFVLSLKEAEFLIPVFGEAVSPNIHYDKATSQNFLASKLADISSNQGMVAQGSPIIRRGETINTEKQQALDSYKAAFVEKNGAGKNIWVFLGYTILTTLIIGVLLLFLVFHARDVYDSFLKMLAIFIWPVVFSLLVYLVEGVSDLSTYLIPFCIVPIVINHFFNARLALFLHIVIILIASFLSSLGYEFTFLQILAGIVAIFTNLKSGNLSGFFRSMIFIFLTYTTGFLGLNLIQEGGFSHIEWMTVGWAFLNAFLTMLAYPLVPLLEKVFGFTTNVTLSELSDMNQPLLRKLSLEAPGTLQHSLQVANLSEAAANAVGADAMLVKVAALYHDIGKTQQPTYYIENQKGHNPHHDISDLESAQIIIEHVTEGIKMAKKAGLPKVVVDFIRTHHGTTRVEYFYRNHQNAHPDEEVDARLFTYPGPRPQTKEQTIMMIADSIEAASKSLKEPSGKDIEALVDKIVAGKIQAGQLDESPLSFSELEICKKVLKSTLGSIHHLRIEYPELSERSK